MRTEIFSSSLSVKVAFLISTLLSEIHSLLVQGCIDQVEGLLYFNSDSQAIEEWDSRISTVCTQLGTILDHCAAQGMTVA